MTKRRSTRSNARSNSGGVILLIIAALVGGFFLLRSDPALASKLPPQVNRAIKSVRLPTGLPNLSGTPGAMPNIQLPTGFPNLSGTPGTLPAIQLPSIGAPAQFGTQTKTSGCMAANGLPDSACTPGAIFPNVTAAQVCQSGYASSVRGVPQAEKDQVYAEYGIASHSSGEFEVDHLVSLELGGSNDISNLWPEAASPAPGFHEKDKVENYLHDQVCSGAMTLGDAQKQIATNWEAVFNQLPQ